AEQALAGLEAGADVGVEVGFADQVVGAAADAPRGAGDDVGIEDDGGAVIEAEFGGVYGGERDKGEQRGGGAPRDDGDGGHGLPWLDRNDRSIISQAERRISRM